MFVVGFNEKKKGEGGAAELTQHLTSKMDDTRQSSRLSCCWEAYTEHVRAPSWFWLLRTCFFFPFDFLVLFLLLLWFATTSLERRQTPEGSRISGGVITAKRTGVKKRASNNRGVDGEVIILGGLRSQDFHFIPSNFLFVYACDSVMDVVEGCDAVR